MLELEWKLKLVGLIKLIGKSGVRKKSGESSRLAVVDVVIVAVVVGVADDATVQN